ncbi:unnamed protein product [Mytilus edulis]|uniref:Uncharacterized protein n=1 Tax=Mytilus edulis TaxID=6550 RepID=A0A8S3TJA1_MYTED|nr:unnamed protein product [Mytilus edulis]
MVKRNLPEEPEEGIKLKFKTNTSWFDTTRKFLPEDNVQDPDTLNKMWKNHKNQNRKRKNTKAIVSRGALQLCNSNNVAVTEMFETDIVQEEDFGIDWDGPIPVGDIDDTAVNVHTTNCPIPPEHSNELKRQIDPLLDRHDYLETLQFINQHDQ